MSSSRLGRRAARLRRRVLLATAAVAGAAFALFAPTLGHGFVNWDDDVYVYANPLLHPPTFARLTWIATHVYYYAYIPVTLWSHALDVALWGLTPRGHHLTNVLLHAANTAVLFLAGLALVRARRAISSLDLAGLSIAAFLFAAHPLRAESVSWISDRKDLLCAFFLLPSLGAYLEAARREERGVWDAASITLFTLAALSKPVAITFPILLLLIDRLWLHRGNSARLLLEKIPYLLVSSILVLISMRQATNPKRPYALTHLTVPESILVRFHALAFPIEKTLAPFGLGPIYPRVGIGWMAVSFLLVVAFTTLCVWV